MDWIKFKSGFIGFDEALGLALANVPSPAVESIDTYYALNRIAADNIRAQVDSPSVDSSTKDGYAVISSDVAKATPTHPIELRLTGICAAGDLTDKIVTPGTAVRILSGATIPSGADAVLAEEFTREESNSVYAFADAHRGRNILEKGADVCLGEVLVNSGSQLSPGVIGLLAAGGVSKLRVFCRPRVGLLATGDEVLLPGEPMETGKLYASNLALQEAWLRSKGIEISTGVCGDSFDKLSTIVESMLDKLDVLVTSGGAWTGDRDLITKVLDKLGWQMIFHRVRMGPGKAVGMGILNKKPVFCLPGGPPSNEMAFLMIALPAILAMAGSGKPAFPELWGRIARPLTGERDWTQFVHCDVKRSGYEFLLRALDMTRRISGMGRTRAIVKIPETVDRIESGAIVSFSAIDRDII